MLTILTPMWAVGGVAAIGIPVAAHLLSRPRYIDAVFPTARFVQAAVAETARADRPRHILLLALRCLALLLVVAAWMQPRWQPDVSAGYAQGGECVVVIVDASASMLRAEQGVPLFDQAKQRAHAVLAALDPGTDTAAVILAARRPALLLPEPGPNVSELMARLQQATCTYEKTDLQQAVDRAVAVLLRQDQPGRIVVISDGQAANRPAAQLSVSARGVRLVEERVGRPDEANLAVRLVDVSPYPPVVGLPMTLTVSLEKTGGAGGTEGDEARFELMAWEGESGTSPGAVQRVPVVLSGESGAARGVRSIRLTPTRTGPTVFRVSADVDDAFGWDNETGLVATVQPAQTTWVFTAVSGGDADTTAARIALALAPEPSASSRRVRVSRWPAVPHGDDLPLPGTVSGGCWVFCGGVDEWGRVGPGPEMDAAITRHLEAGGGVLWIADHPTSRQALQQLAASPLTPVAGAHASDSPGVIASARFDHPLLRVFEGPARASLVGQRLAGVGPATVSNGAAVLLGTADGRPVLAVRETGRGRFAVFNADLSPGRSGFASSPAFVPLVNELVSYLAPGPALPDALHPGDRLPMSVADAASVVGPDGEPLPDATARAPGAYRLLAADGQVVSGVWVGVDPEESDLAAAPPASGKATAAGGRSSSEAALGQAGKPVALWPYCMAAALLCFGVESWVLLGAARREARS